MEPFAAELGRRGLEVELQDDRHLRVSGGAEESGQAVWESAVSTGSVIRGIEPARNSLEQIFLEAVGEVRRADT